MEGEREPKKPRVDDGPVGGVGGGGGGDESRRGDESRGKEEIGEEGRRLGQEGEGDIVEGSGRGRVDGKESVPHHPENLPGELSTTLEEERQHWLVGSIDQGTTSSRFIVFNGEGEPLASHQIEFENLYPEPG